MKKLSALMLLLAFVVLGAVGSAQATKIEYTKSGNNLNFTVFNDTLSTPISAFDVSFGATSDGLNFTNTGLYTNVTDGTAPAGSGWLTAALPASFLDSPWVFTGFFDPTLGVGGPIDPGNNLGLFSTTISMVTAAPLDRLWFNVYSYNVDGSMDTIGSGYISPRDAGTVPEPGTILLVGAGLGGLMLYRRKKS